MIGFIGEHFLYLVLGAQTCFIGALVFVSVEDALRATRRDRRGTEGEAQPL
jgi:hypothetical protein